MGHLVNPIGYRLDRSIGWTGKCSILFNDIPSISSNFFFFKVVVASIENLLIRNRNFRVLLGEILFIFFKNVLYICLFCYDEYLYIDPLLHWNRKRKKKYKKKLNWKKKLFFFFFKKKKKLFKFWRNWRLNLKLCFFKYKLFYKKYLFSIFKIKFFYKNFILCLIKKYFFFLFKLILKFNQVFFFFLKKVSFVFFLKSSLNLFNFQKVLMGKRRKYNIMLKNKKVNKHKEFRKFFGKRKLKRKVKIFFFRKKNSCKKKISNKKKGLNKNNKKRIYFCKKKNGLKKKYFKKSRFFYLNRLRFLVKKNKGIKKVNFKIFGEKKWYKNYKFKRLAYFTKLKKKIISVFNLNNFSLKVIKKMKKNKKKQIMFFFKRKNRKSLCKTFFLLRFFHCRKNWVKNYLKFKFFFFSSKLKSKRFFKLFYNNVNSIRLKVFSTFLKFSKFFFIYFRYFLLYLKKKITFFSFFNFINFFFKKKDLFNFKNFFNKVLVNNIFFSFFEKKRKKIFVKKFYLFYGNFGKMLRKKVYNKFSFLRSKQFLSLRKQNFQLSCIYNKSLKKFNGVGDYRFFFKKKKYYYKNFLYNYDFLFIFNRGRISNYSLVLRSLISDFRFFSHFCYFFFFSILKNILNINYFEKREKLIFSFKNESKKSLFNLKFFDSWNKRLKLLEIFFFSIQFFLKNNVSRKRFQPYFLEFFRNKFYFFKKLRDKKVKMFSLDNFLVKFYLKLKFFFFKYVILKNVFLFKKTFLIYWYFFLDFKFFFFFLKKKKKKFKIMCFFLKFFRQFKKKNISKKVLFYKKLYLYTLVKKQNIGAKVKYGLFFYYKFIIFLKQYKFDFKMDLSFLYSFYLKLKVYRSISCFSFFKIIKNMLQLGSNKVFSMFFFKWNYLLNYYYNFINNQELSFVFLNNYLKTFIVFSFEFFILFSNFFRNFNLLSFISSTEVTIFYTDILFFYSFFNQLLEMRLWFFFKLYLSFVYYFNKCFVEIKKYYYYLNLVFCWKSYVYFFEIFFYLHISDLLKKFRWFIFLKIIFKKWKFFVESFSVKFLVIDVGEEFSANLFLKFLRFYIFKGIDPRRMLKYINYGVINNPFLNGYCIKLFGRFARRGRARKFKKLFGRIPTSSGELSVDYAQLNFPLKFGVGSLRVWFFFNKNSNFFYENIVDFYEGEEFDNINLRSIG